MALCRDFSGDGALAHQEQTCAEELSTICRRHLAAKICVSRVTLRHDHS
jgi:hypothetical protein